MSFSKAAEPQRLTSDGRLKMDPVFVRGGAELIFTLQEKPTQMSLMRLPLPPPTVPSPPSAGGRGGGEGRKAERLHPLAVTNEFEAGFSPDGRFYAFVQSRGNLNLQMVIRDTQQDREAVYDPGGGFAGMRRPSIAPDGSRVIFGIPANNGQQIASVDNQGQDLRYLTTSGFNNWPAFSPDGKHIAFASSRDGNYEIYVMNADGSRARRLTRSPGLDIRPSWSPDGKRLAFTSNRDGQYEIYIMNADGSGQRRVTHHPERDDYAAWHPDGRRLVIVSERSGKFDLYLVEVPA